MDAIEKKIQKLMDTADGRVVVDTINALTKKVDEDNRERILKAMMDYAEQGRVVFHRGYAVARVVDIVRENETEYADFFRRCVESDDSSKRYFGIKGYAKVLEKESYEYLTGCIFSQEVSLEHKALIIKEISRLSNNPFDAGKLYECRGWKEADIDYEALRAWMQEGFPDGEGYKLPVCHECLVRPQGAAEKLYARLDRILLKKREKKQDLAHPSNWLIKAEQSDLEQIMEKWSLPPVYLDFLEKASPLRADIKIRGYGAVTVYGAQNLIRGQDGYSYNPCSDEKIEDWNPDYVVIAQRSGDPFCIDLQREDTSVYFALHGEGTWAFDTAFESFIDFLKAML